MNQITPVEEVKNALRRLEPQFKLALPPHVSPERFVRVIITAVQQTPDLITCDRQSLYGAAMKSAQDGLLPDGREAALVVFNHNVGGKQNPKWEKHAQYLPMTAGILKKVRNSGELSAISPHVVYEHDEFAYWIDEKGEHLKHVPKLSGERGKVTHAYAVATTKDGAVYIEVMTFEEIEKVREASRAKDSGPWVSWWGEMARKTVIRRLSKRLPMSTDLEQTLHADDSLYDIKDAEIAEDAKSERVEKTKPTRLEKIIDAKKVEPQSTIKPIAQPAKVTSLAQTEPGEDAALGDEVPI